VLSPDT